MSNVILKIENLSKQYRLGLVGTGTISDDLKRWWYNIRGKENPFLIIGEENNRNLKANSSYVWALKDINFEVQKGDVLGIIGKNGAGKSTLLKILSKITTPTTGIIKSRGTVASLLEVGTGFHSELTGKENIFLNGAILGMSKVEISSKLDEIIEFSGCQMFIDTPVKRYSSGMRVRLAFAVAAFLEPDILIIDEVLAVGDIEFQKKAIGKMKDISSGDGRTVIFVSHDMAAIKNICKNVIVIENGKIAYKGNTTDAINYYYKINATKTVIQDLTLVKRANKSYGQQIRITEVIINRDNSENNSDGVIGESLFFKLRIENLSQLKFANISFTISVFNYSGNFLFACRSDCINKLYTIEPEKSEYLLKIKKLPLNKGEYTVNINCSSNDKMLDSVHNAASFFVQEGDFYGYGKIPAKRRNGVFINYEWV